MYEIKYKDGSVKKFETLVNADLSYADLSRSTGGECLSENL